MFNKKCVIIEHIQSSGTGNSYEFETMFVGNT